MTCYLLILMLGVLLCLCLAPQSELRESAYRALESSALMVGRFGGDEADDEADDAPRHEEIRTSPRAQARRSKSPGPSKHGPDTKWKTVLYRKRPTWFQVRLMRQITRRHLGDRPCNSLEHSKEPRGG